jgi:hypothetical protein
MVSSVAQAAAALRSAQWDGDAGATAGRLPNHVTSAHPAGAWRQFTAISCSSHMLGLGRLARAGVASAACAFAERGVAARWPRGREQLMSSVRGIDGRANRGPTGRGTGSRRLP